jgi:hypothetical protein
MTNTKPIPGLTLCTCVLFLIATVVSGGDSGVVAEENPYDPNQYIVKALGKHPIICIGEGDHAVADSHEIIRQILSDKNIQNILDVIIVEFATERYQAVLDDFIQGKEVYFGELAKVWRDTSTSPITPWDSPIYYELLKKVRENNRWLSLDKKIRILAGDPLIKWEEIQNRDDFRKFRVPRNQYVSDLAIRQAFQLNKKVMIIYGGLHLAKMNVGPKGDPRNPITYRIQLKHPDSVKYIEFMKPEDLHITERLSSLKKGKLYETKSHWVGKISAQYFFPGVYKPQIDRKIGKATMKKMVLYKNYFVQDIVDALIYIGPSKDWKIVSGSQDAYQDDEYWAELNRRSKIRFDRPMDESLRKKF